MRIKRRKRKKVVSREESNGLLVSPCKGCGREHKDKRYKQCKRCEDPAAYAQAVEIACQHLPAGIDCSEPLAVNAKSDSSIRQLTECRMIT